MAPAALPLWNRPRSLPVATSYEVSDAASALANLVRQVVTTIRALGETTTNGQRDRLWRDGKVTCLRLLTSASESRPKP